MEARVIELRRNRMKAMRGQVPETLTSGRLQSMGRGPRPSFPYRLLRSAKLTKLQADVLELIRVAPRDVKQASDALGIGEWSRVRHALDQLVNRSLAEEVHGYPVTWRAL